MKTVGIVGGLGPESTVEYYQKIIKKYKEKTDTDNYPEIHIVSINMTEMLGYVRQKKYAQLVELLGIAIERLHKTAVDFVVIASNTPHIVFDQLNKKSNVKLISIVETACEQIRTCGYKKALLTGTLFTMQENFYEKVGLKYGITIVVPTNEDMLEIHNVIFPELEEGIIITSKKEKYVRTVEKYVKRENIDCVILGCTELPLMISEKDLSVPIINTSEIHVTKIVEELLN